VGIYCRVNGDGGGHYLTTAPDPEKLKGLTYSYAASVERSGAWYRTPEFYAVVVLTIFVFLNIRFF
jgi:hypothetical protein